MEYLDKLVGVAPRPFSLTETKFDQSTFYGRWRYFTDLINPLNLLYSDEQALEYKKLLDQYKEGKISSSIWNLNQLAIV